MKNFFQLPDYTGEEFAETLLSGSGFRLERIVSRGDSSPEGFWYDQEEDEYVLLLQGQAVLEYPGDQLVSLKPGDQLVIPAGCRHRVAKTSASPPAVWLTIFGQFSS